MSATFDQAIRYRFVFIGYRSTQVYKKRFLNKYEPINKVNICSFLLITRSFIALIFISDFINCPERRLKAIFLLPSWREGRENGHAILH